MAPFDCPKVNPINFSVHKSTAATFHTITFVYFSILGGVWGSGVGSDAHESFFFVKWNRFCGAEVLRFFERLISKHESLRGALYGVKVSQTWARESVPPPIAPCQVQGSGFRMKGSG